MRTYLTINLVVLMFAVSLGGVTGCRSFSSTPISRFDNNFFAGESNGHPRLGQKARPYKGTPVKLKVQTHTDVFIEEEYDLVLDDNIGWRYNKLGKKFYSVRTEPVMTEQVVFVDFKRPASGMLDMDVEYSSDQYLKAINSKVTDTTIADTAGLIQEVVKFASPTAKGGEAAPPVVRQTKEKRVVAYRRFDIDAPDYESQVEQFVNQYLNGCNSCDTLPSYDQL